MPAPPFGTASAYADSFPSPPPKQVTVSAETCFNLGTFKDVVRQYRRLDDQIITRLNRAQAQLRDQNRIASQSTFSSSSRGIDTSGAGVEAMCAKMWLEMMAGWAHRQTLLTFCVQTVQNSVEGKKRNLNDIPTTAPHWERGIKEEEVLVDQLANEESIEAIIRKRTLEAFKSRCPFFAPSSSDTVDKGWWDLADRGMKGRGPEIA